MKRTDTLLLCPDAAIFFGFNIFICVEKKKIETLWN